VKLIVRPPGSATTVTSPFAPIVGEPMNAVPFAASRKRPVCSAWLIVRSSMSITVRPVYFGASCAGGIG